jgi:hypothetical protein
MPKLKYHLDISSLRSSVAGRKWRASFRRTAQKSPY